MRSKQKLDHQGIQQSERVLHDKKYAGTSRRFFSGIKIKKSDISDPEIYQKK
jgi:hypothetical protein